MSSRFDKTVAPVVVTPETASNNESTTEVCRIRSKGIEDKKLRANQTSTMIRKPSRRYKSPPLDLKGSQSIMPSKIVSENDSVN